MEPSHARHGARKIGASCAGLTVTRWTSLEARAPFKEVPRPASAVKSLTSTYTKRSPWWCCGGRRYRRDRQSDTALAKPRRRSASFVSNARRNECQGSVPRAGVTSRMLIISL
eukprot:scaffold825_cov249-Pinguiococcus_pyrenoidosus.AAC.22